MTTHFPTAPVRSAHVSSADVHSAQVHSADVPRAIDMLTPAQVCERLALTQHDLLASVNRGDLAAYDLGDGIRFRAADVHCMADNLVAV